jgi:hypothetical protein
MGENIIRTSMGVESLCSVVITFCGAGPSGAVWCGKQVVPGDSLEPWGAKGVLDLERICTAGDS